MAARSLQSHLVVTRRLRGRPTKACVEASPTAVPLPAASRSVRAEVDDSLSQRPISLDPVGYFLIKVVGDSSIIAELYANTINTEGMACDPRTGKPIPCRGGYRPPPPVSVYEGRTAKEVSVAIFEGPNAVRELMLNHANYIGRELQKAEECLYSGNAYVQD